MTTLFENHQWRVTRDGLDAIHETYEIAIWQVADSRQEKDGLVFEWPLQLAQKPWVDINAFIEAWAFALDLFIRERGERETIQPVPLARTILQAKRISEAA